MNAMTNCRRCDDTHWSIEYTGNWQRGDYEGASEATLTYTEQAGATAVLSFEGSEVTYVYTKAYNRGFAAITIDGESKGLLDLYSPRIEWQTRTTFGGLRSGRHTIEIRATDNIAPARGALRSTWTSCWSDSGVTPTSFRRSPGGAPDASARRSK